METVIIRRTFWIGNYETFSIEASGQGTNINQARLLASKNVLELAQQEMIRIFGIRVQNTTSSPYDQVVLELTGINNELGI